MKKLIKYILPLFVVLISSCEDVIDVDLKDGERLLVVDAFVDNLRSQQKIRLSYTNSYFSQTNTPGLAGATVVLTDVTNGNTYNFTDNNNGDYVFNLQTTDTIGYVNHNYQLSVNYQGNNYVAYSKANRTAPADSIAIEKREASGFTTEGYYCTLIARDVPGPVVDYYWIKSYKNNVLYNQGNQINLSIDAANGSGADGFYFIPPIAQGITPFGNPFSENDICRVEIHGITEETYNFLTQVITQTTNSGLFATTPENLKTNVKATTANSPKAIGWFNISMASYKEVVVK